MTTVVAFRWARPVSVPVVAYVLKAIEKLLDRDRSVLRQVKEIQAM